MQRYINSMEHLPQKQRVFIVGKVLNDSCNLYDMAAQWLVDPIDLLSECLKLTKSITETDAIDIDHARVLIRRWGKKETAKFEKMLSLEGYYGKAEQDSALREEKEELREEGYGQSTQATDSQGRAAVQTSA